MNDSLAYLRTPVAIRERAAKVLKYVEDGQSQWFQLDPNGLETAVQATLAVTRERFPNPAAIPFHSRWRHFESGGRDRWSALAERLKSMACYTMKVREWNDSIVFLHEVISGTADRSYGIHVAKLAGLPAAVVARAEEVLRALEEGREGHKPLAKIDDLPLFGASAPVPKGSAVEDALKAIEPDALSPKEALEILYDLKRKLQ